MSDEYIIEQAKKLKSEGYDYGKIRSYLKNAGHDDDVITTAFKRMDEDEIHELHLNQKIRAAWIKLIVSIVLAAVGVVYNVYRFGLDETIDFVFLLLPLSIFVAAYYSFRSIRSRKYTPAQIIRDNRKPER